MHWLIRKILDRLPKFTKSYGETQILFINVTILNMAISNSNCRGYKQQ